MSAIPHYLFRSCRNKDCAKGCVLYIPVSNPDFIPSFNISTADQPTWIAVPCKGCSCLGSQHLHSVEFPDRPSSCGEANPSLYVLQRLDKEGRVKSVSLPKDKVSNKDIVTAVCNTFKADPRFAVIDSGWHLLRVLSQGTGRSATMELMEGGSMNDITFEVWKKGVNPSIRNAGPGYRHPVFIVLAMPNSPNEVHDSPSHDEPTPSSVHDKTGANTMSTPSEPTHNDYPDWQEMVCCSISVARPMLATELKVLEEPKTLLSRTLEKRFVKDFALGPFGLHGVIPILDQLYGFVIYYVPLPAHHRSMSQFSRAT
ncbi:hypothetical protein BD309DRAFT_984956 [Dichomitus squalens]|nr:hypothetical protein BD309DRAFT_984956 [Dichomitus squalens]